MVYLDPVAVVAEGVPWWVILLAVLAGLLVLALLVLLLWKVRLGEGGAGGGWASLVWRWPFMRGSHPPTSFTQQIFTEQLPCMCQGLCQVLDDSETSQMQILSSGI